LERRWRFRRRLLLPATTLAAWVHAQPWLTLGVDGTVDVRGELTRGQQDRARSGGTWQLAVAVADDAATWTGLIGALMATGMLPETAKMVAHTCPILERTAPNTYRLRGHSDSGLAERHSSQVEALPAARS
jgi:hypothetical protein